MKLSNFHQKYHVRRDVIFKTIFRTIRKYYLKDFKSLHDFTKDSGYILIREISEVKMREYLRDNFERNNTKIMKWIFTSILDPHAKHFELDASGSKIRDLVFKILYRFNRQVMEELLGYEEFIELISKPLNQLSMIDLLMNHREDEEIKKAYIKQLDLLKNICISEAATIPKILLNFL